MKKKRVTEISSIFQQCKKGKMILASAVSEEQLVEISDIEKKPR